jgi:hypothetical protein
MYFLVKETDQVFIRNQINKRLAEIAEKRAAARRR